MGIIGKAAEFAMHAHAGQKRKYTGEPYFVHCAEVAALTSSTFVLGREAIAAAFLHDTIEDCPEVDYQLLRQIFGHTVAYMVVQLTDNETGNRAARKAASRERLSQASYAVKTIKLADLISNTRSIVACDPAFAKVYLEEKRLLLPCLIEGDRHLYEQAYEQAHA